LFFSTSLQASYYGVGDASELKNIRVAR